MWKFIKIPLEISILISPLSGLLINTPKTDPGPAIFIIFTIIAGIPLIGIFGLVFSKYIIKSEDYGFIISISIPALLIILFQHAVSGS